MENPYRDPTLESQESVHDENHSCDDEELIFQNQISSQLVSSIGLSVSKIQSELESTHSAGHLLLRNLEQNFFNKNSKIQDSKNENLSDSSDSCDEKIINISNVSQKYVDQSVRRPVLGHRMTFGTPSGLRVGDIMYSFGKQTITEKIDIESENYHSNEEINYEDKISIFNNKLSEPKISKKLSKMMSLLIESLDSAKILLENNKKAMVNTLKKQSNIYIKEIEYIIATHPLQISQDQVVQLSHQAKILVSSDQGNHISPKVKKRFAKNVVKMLRERQNYIIEQSSNISNSKSLSQFKKKSSPGQKSQIIDARQTANFALNQMTKSYDNFLKINQRNQQSAKVLKIGFGCVSSRALSNRSQTVSSLVQRRVAKSQLQKSDSMTNSDFGQLKTFHKGLQKYVQKNCKNRNDETSFTGLKKFQLQKKNVQPKQSKSTISLKKHNFTPTRSVGNLRKSSPEVDDSWI